MKKQKKERLFKKLCAILLVFVICVLLFPAKDYAGAEETVEQEKCQWKAETTMPTAKRGCKKLMELEGKIYIMGGMILHGFSSNNAIDNKVEIYDTKTKTWSNGKDMPKAYGFSNYAMVGNKIYVMGGETCGPDYVKYKDVYIYDTSKDTWETAKEMPKAQCCASTVVIGNKIYVISGYGPTQDENIIQIYDTELDTWSLLDIPSSVSRQAHAACHIYDGKIYIIGGEYWTTKGNSINTLNIYDPDNNTWTSGKELPDALTGVTSIIINNKIYIIGGMRIKDNQEAIYTDKVYIYDIDENTWSEGPTLSSPRQGSMAALVKDRIYLFGGVDENKNIMNTVEVLDLNPKQDTLRILMNENEQQQLSVSYNLEDNKEYQWTSSDESVVSVDDGGLATAIGEGDAEVTVKTEDESYTEVIAIKVVSMRKLAAHIQVDGTVRLYLAEDASTVVWKSGNEAIATVDETGMVTGKKKGLVAITAELDGKEYELYVRVAEK